MPLKLVETRNSKTANLYIRGSYLGVAIDKSCRTDRRSVALSELKRIEREIERGQYGHQATTEGTFLSAAVAYMEAGRSRRFIAPLIKHMGARPLSEIVQAVIDDAAVKLYPDCSPATRNRCVYTPVSAILRHAKVKTEVERPKGAKGRIVTDWLTEDDAFGIISAAEKFDPEFALLLKFLLYTGCRLGAALNLRREDVRIEQSAAWLRHQKGQQHADVRLRADLRDALAAHLRSHNEHRVFRFLQGGHLKHQLVRAKLAYLGLACPVRRPEKWRAPPYRLAWANFHTFRHTWATWMRQAGTDVQGLVATGNWRDPRSAARYAHAVARDEWSRVDLLPGMGKKSRL